MLALLVACAPSSELAELEVVGATLTELVDVRVGAGLGIAFASATLEVQEAGGDTQDFAVTLSGPRLGLVAEGAVGVGYLETPLVWYDGSRPGSDLLGTYAGIEYGAATGVGASAALLENEFGVGMIIGTIDLGASMTVGYEWLTLSAGESELP